MQKDQYVLMVCWKGRTAAEARARTRGVAGATTRNKQGLRPEGRDQTCNWSIRVNCVTSEEGSTSWVVATGGKANHLADHNHQLEVSAAVHANRNAILSDEMKEEIRCLAEHNMKPTDLAHFMSVKYPQLQVTAKDVSNITSKDGCPPDWGQAARALNLLQKLKDRDPGWVIEVR